MSENPNATRVRPFEATENADWLRLALAALPTARARSLLRHFGTPRAVFEAVGDAPLSELREEFGLTEKAISKLRANAAKDVAKLLAAMDEHAIAVVRESEFPPLLREIEDDAPPFLFARGSFELPTDERAVAIVGTRSVTEYGRGLAHRMALDFARAGWTVVSGLARGVDTAAHEGALEGGGRTIAVTGCGLDIVYPSENRELMTRIEHSGAVLSEWAPTTPPEAWHFPARNRIIAGLSYGIVVVESQVKSGAMITATRAGEFGRPVFAVPGNVHKPQSRGPHHLIKEGAALIECAQDVIDFLAREAWTRELVGLQSSDDDFIETAEDEAERIVTSSRPAKPNRPTSASTSVEAPSGPPPGLSSDESRVWLCLEVEPRHLDDIAAQADLNVGAVNTALVLLEIKGAARRLPGNLFVKVIG